MSKLLLHDFKDKKSDLHLTNDSDLRFLAVVKNSEISLNFDIMHENNSLECYVIIPFLEEQNVKLSLKANIQANNSKTTINIIALAHDNSTVSLNGNLHIQQWIKKVEAALYEEALLLWNAKYISLIPWLRVDSPDVVASHWAKIHRISPERLFYMQSRGLSMDKAIAMIINSYSQWISDKLNLNEKEKSDFYSMID